MIQISNDLIITLSYKNCSVCQVRTWHNGSSFPVSRICINVSRSKIFVQNCSERQKSFPSFFFFLIMKRKKGTRDCLTRNLEGSVTSRNFNFRREICITGGLKVTRKGGREVSEPKEAVNLLSLGHFCARTANKKGSGRGGQDRFPAKLFSRDSRETNFTRRNFKDEEVWKLLWIRENWG